ncbi:hypothetical protein SteCoe_36098 [Stentor coeruleus]|uniref:Ribosome recycling factor domain-containing protein n=1 Tax=Stentor coeruleus TaxID=5963 RepID=A0A1R2AQU3_9CILI|nr:hypothetical protein SteCoe_36098 [Stentor coeruleus]
MILRFSRFVHTKFYLNTLGSQAPVRFFAKKGSKNSKEEPQGSTINFDMEKLKREMDTSIKNFENSLQKVTIGRGDPRIFDKVYVQQKHTNLANIAQIIPKNANEITIKPFDSSDIEDILTALNLSEIRVQARKEAGGIIHITIPKPTNDYRNELIKQARDFAEETRQSLRKKRQGSLHTVKDMKDEDELKRIKNDVQKVTDKYTETVEKMLKDKEKSLST